jgi:hypothetical protein
MEHFVSVQEAHQAYANDDSPYVLSFNVSISEFRRMLVGVKPIVNGVSQPSKLLSFAVAVVGPSGVHGQELFVSVQNAERFYQELIGALDSGNEKGQAVLRRQSRAVVPALAHR